MNSITITGRLTRDPELRTTTSGKSLVNFSVAVDKQIKPTDGSPTADFFNVTAWGKTAEFVTNYLAKGRLVAVAGRMESRKYKDKDNNQREAWEITADRVEGLDRPREDAPTAPVTNDDEYDPFKDE